MRRIESTNRVSNMQELSSISRALQSHAQRSTACGMNACVHIHLTGHFSDLWLPSPSLHLIIKPPHFWVFWIRMPLPTPRPFLSLESGPGQAAAREPRAPGHHPPLIRLQEHAETFCFTTGTCWLTRIVLASRTSVLWGNALGQ